MSTDAVGYLLGLLTIGMSFVAVKYRNMLLTLGSAALWATLLAYILANTTAGTNWQSMFILSVAAFLCAFALISFFTRNKGEGSFINNIGKLRNTDNESEKLTNPKRGLMGLSTEEYRAYVRSKMNRRRR